MSTIVKNKFSGEKRIIFSLLVFFVLSFSFVAYVEKKQLTSTNNTSWELYFENPTSQDLTFGVKNDGRTANFHWKEFALNGDTLKEGDIAILAGQTGRIDLGEKIETEKISIDVSRQGGEKKELYKN